MKTLLGVIFVLQLCLSISAQELGFQIGKVYKKSITKEKLASVKTLMDINPGFPSSWISSYSSVMISVNTGEDALAISELASARSRDEILTSQQIDMLHDARLGHEIRVSVWYSPKSEILNKRDLREIKFSYTIVPFQEARYPDGSEKLAAIIKDEVQDEISKISQEFPIALVRFTINEVGEAVDIRITESSGNGAIDKLLSDSISNMPKWVPAEKADGKKTTQEFELRVGNIVGC